MGRQAAIRDAHIERLDGGTFIVRTAAGDLLRVPVEVICDESKVWRIGDVGTLLVENWWARRRNVASARSVDASVSNVSVVRPRRVSDNTQALTSATSAQEAEEVPEREEIDAETFRGMVADEIAGTLSAENVATLRLHENLDRFREEIIQLKKDVEEKLVQRKIRFNAFSTKCYRKGCAASDTFFLERDRYEEWRGEMLAAHRMIERRIGEIKVKKKATEKSQDKVRQEMWDLLAEAGKRICDPRWRIRYAALLTQCGRS